MNMKNLFHIISFLIVISLFSCGMQISTLSQSSSPSEEEPVQNGNAVDAVPVERTPAVKTLHTIFENNLPVQGFSYVYGGNTEYEVLPSKGTTEEVFAMYMDGAAYSGVTISLGVDNTLNLKKAKGF